MKTLEQIREWTKLEADKPTPPTKLFMDVCDELVLIDAYQGLLHNHSIEEQVEQLSREVAFNTADYTVRKALILVAEPMNVAPFDLFWERLSPNDKEYALNKTRESIKKVCSLDPKLAKHYDFANNRFYCKDDMEMLARIEDSIKYINGLLGES